MICTNYEDGETYTRYHKYSNPMIGRKQIYQRVDGKWLNWCRPTPEDSRPCKISISNKGAVLTTYHDYKLETEKWSKHFGVPIGTTISLKRKYYLDFEFVTRRVEIEGYRLNGESINGKPDYTRTWNCRLKDASSPSIKGRIEGVIK